jgi:hypothetical protein
VIVSDPSLCIKGICSGLGEDLQQVLREQIFVCGLLREQINVDQGCLLGSESFTGIIFPERFRMHNEGILRRLD